MGIPWSDVITLVAVVEGINENGFPETRTELREGIYANKKSVRSNEFYLAKQSGIHLSYMFEVRSVDYQGEEQLIYEGKEFNIERTYEKGEFIELTCARKDDDHGN